MAKNASMGESIGELKNLVVAYAKQETIEPIKGLGRFIAFGLAGVIFIGLGLGMALLAGLRALQTETGTTFTGDWSWAPYGIMTVVCLVLIGVALAAANRGGRR